MNEHHHEHLHNHGGNLADLMASIPTEQQFFMAADIFSMLCDSTRLRILWLLCHTEECVSDIAAAVKEAVANSGLCLDDIASFGIGTPGAIDTKNGIIKSCEKRPVSSSSIDKLVD